MFGSLAPGMPKPTVAKPKKPRKWKAPGMAAYRGVSQQPMPKPDAETPAESGLGDESES